MKLGPRDRPRTTALLAFAIAIAALAGCGAAEPKSTVTASWQGLLLLATLSGLDQLLKLAGIGPFARFGINLCSLYSATVEMRLLGLLYFKNKDQLAWL